MARTSLRPPGPLVAYLPDAAPELLAEYLIAFANSDGGTVVIGLDERGRPTGTVYAEELEGLLRAAAAVHQALQALGLLREDLELAAGLGLEFRIDRRRLTHRLDARHLGLRLGVHDLFRLRRLRDRLEFRALLLFDLLRQRLGRLRLGQVLRLAHAGVRLAGPRLGLLERLGRD